MSYQVLARKWRPSNFSELVGQEHVVAAISNALDNDRLHHAYLFTGTRGVGKTTIARIFSKSLNCERGMSSTPCGECNTCKEIEQGNYIDLLEIDAASRTKVEDTRELLDNVQYKPTRGEYKVYLIDEVHMLSKHSFNALLKTLEEPPPHVKFLLATTDPQKLPVTILSRCLQFNLKAMSREQISDQLAHILGHEGLPFEKDAVLQLARAAQGSMRDALSLTDQAIAQGNGQVSTQVVTDMLGLLDKGQILKLVNAVVTQDKQGVMQQVEQLSLQAPDYAAVLAEIMSLLHQIALTQFVPEACKLETVSPRAIYHLAKSIPAEQVQLLYQIALNGKKDLPYAADGRSGLEMTLLRMLAFTPKALDISLDEFVELTPSAPPPVPEIQQPEGETATAKQQEQNDQQLETEQVQSERQALQIEQDDIIAQSQMLATEVADEPQQAEQLDIQPHSNDYQAQINTQTADLLALNEELEQQSQALQESADSVKKFDQVDQAESFEIRSKPVPVNEPESASHSAPESIEATSESSFDPHEHLAVENIAEVDIEVPAFLPDGTKVTRAAQIDTWSKIIDDSGLQGLSKQLALHSSYHQQGDQIKLLLQQQSRQLDTSEARQAIQRILNQVLQMNVQLVVEYGDPMNTPFALQQEVNKVRQTHAEQSVQQHQVIHQFQQDFGANVLNDSIKPR